MLGEERGAVIVDPVQQLPLVQELPAVRKIASFTPVGIHAKVAHAFTNSIRFKLMTR